METFPTAPKGVEIGRRLLTSSEVELMETISNVRFAQKGFPASDFLGS